MTRADSAEFAGERQHAMLRSMKNSSLKNPNARIVPEMSNKPTASPTPALEDMPTPSDERRVDYVATSKAVYDALLELEGHVVMTDAERRKAIDILHAKSDHAWLWITVSLVAGVSLGGLGGYYLAKKE